VDAYCLGGLLVIAALLWAPAWRQPDSVWYPPGADFSDLTVTHWPNMQLVAHSIRRWGEVPLWRPWIMGGAPFVGNPLSALFYPPNWLFAIVPVTPAFHVLFAFHLFVAGATAYGLARWSYGCSAGAAFLAGLGYAVTPKLIAHIAAGHVGLSQAFAWLPLSVALLRAAFSWQSAGWAAACGSVLALICLADPRVAFYDALLLAIYAAYRLLGTWRRAGIRATLSLGARLAVVPLMTFLVGAVQILPTLELMASTTRSSLSVIEAGRDSLPWRYLVGYLIADRGGYHEWMTYLGLLPLALAALALWRSTERERWFWAALATGCVVYSLGIHTPLYPLLYRLVPSLGWVRVPPRALLLAILAVNLLAAMGVDALLAEWQPLARRRATLAAAASFMGCAALGIGFALLLRGQVPANVLSLAIVGAATSVVIWVALHMPDRFKASMSGAALVQGAMAALLLGDLVPVARSLLVLRPASEVWAEGAEVAAFLSAREERPFRVYSPSYSIPQHVGALWGIEQLDGVDPSQLRWTAAYMSLAGGYAGTGYGVTIPPFPDDVDVHTAFRTAVPNAALLGLLNGQYVVAEFPIDAANLRLEARVGSSYVYLNERTLPRAFLLYRAQPVTGWEEAQAQLHAGYDPSAGALVEGGTALSGPPGWQPATLEHLTPNRIVVEADAIEPTLLVLGETWYPGWQVTVDGVRQPEYRVDGIVRGVYLDPGKHTIVWRYAPASLHWGAALTLSALAAWVIGGLAWRR
jgi:hypothetical protein